MNLDDGAKVSSILNTQFSAIIDNKGTVLQTLSLFVFLLGASIENRKKRNIHPKFYIKYNFSFCCFILSALLTAYFIILILTGNVSSWFHYSGSSSNYENTHIVYLTIICLVFTSVEFSRLYQKKCSNLISVIKKINKIYVIDVTLIAFVLVISGNRNEALLILLPPVVAYCIFVKNLSNGRFLILLTIGVFGMIILGLTRQTGVSEQNVANTELSLYGSTRDFAFISMDNKYLISYTDNNEPVYFKNAIITAFSSIPLMGGLYAGATNQEFDKRSTDITTIGMQTKDNMDSGLGTGLIGDLYYTSNAWFAVLFMYCFGMFQAYLYNRFMINKRYSIWLLLIYLFIFSNVVYCIRAEWTMPLRYIGFSFVLMLVLLSIKPAKL